MSTGARHALHLNFDSAEASWNHGILRIFGCEQGLPDRNLTVYMLLICNSLGHWMTAQSKMRIVHKSVACQENSMVEQESVAQ
jgi:hypothetical protein